MSITTKVLNDMLNGFIAIHDTYVTALTEPDISSEILTGRKAIDFSEASAAYIVGDSLEDLVIPEGTTVTHLAVFDSEQDGELLCIVELDNPETFSNEGSLSVKQLKISLV